MGPQLLQHVGECNVLVAGQGGKIVDLAQVGSQQCVARPQLLVLPVRLQASLGLPTSAQPAVLPLTEPPAQAHQVSCGWYSLRRDGLFGSAVPLWLVPLSFQRYFISKDTAFAEQSTSC